MNRLMNYGLSGLASLCAFTALLLPSSVLAQSLLLTLDGEETIEIPMGSPPADGGVQPIQDYNGSYQGDGYKISWQLRLTLSNPNSSAPLKATLAKLPNGSSVPAILVENQTSTPRAFELQFSFPALAALKDLEADGSLGLKLVASADGGAINCGPIGSASSLMNVVNVDSGGSAPISYCPFNMATTGAGTAATTFFIGAPSGAPGQGMAISGPLYSQIGMRVGGLLTGSDQMGISPFVMVYGKVMCPGDINLDFKTDNADLGALLAAWGTNNLTADLTADGIVDGQDLGLLLANFGVCAQTPSEPMTEGGVAGEGEKTAIVVEPVAGAVDSVVAPESAAAPAKAVSVAKACELKTIKKAAKQKVANKKIAAKKKAQALKRFKRCVEAQIDR